MRIEGKSERCVQLMISSVMANNLSIFEEKELKIKKAFGKFAIFNQPRFQMKLK
jgi:hypothetical protein